MLTLEQVRAVNDGFKSGDLNAALRPLEETIDLRSNELPHLDKTALAALKEGLQNGEDAATWAQALLHPNISVRRFARKMFMGLGDEAAPLFDPLRQRLEGYWSEGKPLPYGDNAREAALWRAQDEMVNGAVEMLLRSHPEKFLAFYAEKIDGAPPEHDDSQDGREWQERQEAASDALEEEIVRLLTDEWGSEWAEPGKRWKLPSRVMSDVMERAHQKPEVLALTEAVGEYPHDDETAEWEPLQLLTSALSGYLTSGRTGPVRRIAERMTPILWQWIYGAFDFGSSPEERERIARRVNEFRWWGVTSLLGSERSQNEIVPLLLRAKAPLFESLQKYLATDDDEEEKAEIGEKQVVELWLTLASGLDDAFRVPSDANTWALSPEVEPEMLRQIFAGFELHQSRDSLASTLIDVAERVEHARRIQSGNAPETVPQETQEIEHETFEEEAPEIVRELGLYEVLADAQIRAIYDAEGYSGRDTRSRLAEAMSRTMEEMSYREEPEKQVQLLDQPAAHPHDPDKIMSRLTYWLMWARGLGENGAQKLEESIWAQAAPKLWARLDARLEEYRRAETEPLEPKIEQKLTAREVKEWRAQTRRDKREAIGSEISDITKLLFVVEGVEARRKAIEMADRPSCREVREQMEFNAFEELNHFPDAFRLKVRPSQRIEWKLEEEWEWILRRGEEQLEKVKEEWSRTRLEGQLAAGYYRRGQFEKFKEMVVRTDVFPSSVATAALALDDFEAWGVLIGTGDRWESHELTVFWEAQQVESERKARAIGVVIQMLTTTSKDAVARRLLGWLALTAPAELESYVSELESALESSLVPVKKWAMGLLCKLPLSNFDHERAASTIGEALWSENTGLAKEAAKFLSALGAQDPVVVGIIWDALCDATALDNVGVTEAVYRALAQLKTKDKSLKLSEAAREKLEALVGIQAERFAKFEKKLAS